MVVAKNIITGFTRGTATECIVELVSDVLLVNFLFELSVFGHGLLVE